MAETLVPTRWAEMFEVARAKAMPRKFPSSSSERKDQPAMARILPITGVDAILTSR